MQKMIKEVDFFVHTNDVDCNDIIKPDVVLNYFQDIAAMHAADLGCGYEVMKKRNLAWVVLYQKFEIIKIPPYLNSVKAVTWPKPKQRLEFEREYLIKDLDDNICVKGISNWVVIDLNSRNLVRSDSIDFNGEYYEHTNYPEKCKRKLNLNTDLITEYFDYVVSYSDLDHNRHMNNSKYLDLILKLYPFYKSNKYVKNVEIAFIKEAKYNDNIKVGHYSLDNNEVYIGLINDEKCFECIIGVEEI